MKQLACKKSCKGDVILSIANSGFRKFKKVQRARSLVFYFKPSYMYVYALDTIDRVNIQLVNASSMPAKLVLVVKSSCVLTFINLGPCVTRQRPFALFIVLNKFLNAFVFIQQQAKPGLTIATWSQKMEIRMLLKDFYVLKSAKNTFLCIKYSNMWLWHRKWPKYTSNIL